ncbi:hypothetical protein ACP70R_025009 [Stipagrostis hirtigluma subsp. patula]
MARSGSLMKKSCDCCKRYLDHLEEKKQDMTCFLKRMTGNFKHCMTVPHRFLKRFTEKLSGIIKLESPNGCLYDVEVTEHSNKMVFRHGWEAFVDAHHIEENDSLLFRHIEKCCFEVLIFGSDGCERVFSCAGIKNTPCDNSSGSHHEATESGSETAKVAATSSPYEDSGEDIPSENESSESDDIQTEADYVLSCRSYLSEEQKERVISLIQEIEPEITVLVAVLQRSHVQPPGPYLAVPKEYALAHFPHGGASITLQRPGNSKKWHPKFYKRKDRSIYMLRGQWLQFVRDNHVQEGDICLLLPTKGGRRFTFSVYLLPATATHSSGGTDRQSVGTCHDNSSAKMVSDVQIKEEPTDGEDVSRGSSMHETSRKSLESNDSGGPSEPSYIVPCHGRLSHSQKKIVKAKVEAIQSETPIYVATMRISNVGVSQPMLEFGARYARVHLPASGQPLMLQCGRKIWETKLFVRDGRRWFLRGGWSQFVGDNGLRVGDICLFQLKNERELTMKVHIISREMF